MSSIRVYVDLDDVYDEMDRYDKQKMVEWLFEDGILEKHPNPEIRKIARSDEETFGERELRDNLTKIWNSYYQLSPDQEELIKSIANNF
jgi:hypothetical protein